MVCPEFHGSQYERYGYRDFTRRARADGNVLGAQPRILPRLPASV